MCPKNVILCSLFWRKHRSGYLEYADLAYYWADHTYFVIVPFTTAAIQSFVAVATNTGFTSHTTVKDAMAIMDYLGCDQEWAMSWWRLMMGTCVGLPEWKWVAMMDLLLRAKANVDGIMVATIPTGEDRYPDGFGDGMRDSD